MIRYADRILGPNTLTGAPQIVRWLNDANDARLNPDDVSRHFVSQLGQDLVLGKHTVELMLSSERLSETIEAMNKLFPLSGEYYPKHTYRPFPELPAGTKFMSVDGKTMSFTQM